MNKDEKINAAGNSASEEAANKLNDESLTNASENTGKSITGEANAIEDDIAPLEHGHQKNPGSSGAFPVGAFDTSKE